MLSFGVSGNPGPDDGYNPFSVVHKKHGGKSLPVLELLSKVADADTTHIHRQTGLSEIEARRFLADLERCGLVVKKGSDHYRINFAAFDPEIWQILDTPMRRMARQMSLQAREIVPDLQAEYPRTNLSRAGFPFSLVGAIVIGAFGLDESGVGRLAERDLIWVAKPQPGRRRYTILCQIGAPSPYPLYGIHSDTFAGVGFCCFGENSQMNKRREEVKALPDLVWHWKAQGGSMDEIEIFTRWLAALTKEHANRPFKLEDRPRAETSVSLDRSQKAFAMACENGLIGASSKGGYGLRFPVFDHHDLSLFAPFRDRTAIIVVNEMLKMRELFRSAYERTRFHEQGINLQEVMNLVYHHSYSLAFEDLLSSERSVCLPAHDGLQSVGYALLWK